MTKSIEGDRRIVKEKEERRKRVKGYEGERKIAEKKEEKRKRKTNSEEEAPPSMSMLTMLPGERSKPLLALFLAKEAMVRESLFVLISWSYTPSSFSFQSIVNCWLMLLM